MAEATVTWTPDAIRELRRRLGLSQARFAEVVGCRLFAVTRWENGHARPSRVFSSKLTSLAAEPAR